MKVKFHMFPKRYHMRGVFVFRKRAPGCRTVVLSKQEASGIQNIEQATKWSEEMDRKRNNQFNNLLQKNIYFLVEYIQYNPSIRY